MEGEEILHQDDVETVIEENVSENFETNLGAVSDDGVIADPASPGGTYDQAEVVALRTAIVAILNVLREANIIPTA